MSGRINCTKLNETSLLANGSPSAKIVAGQPFIHEASFHSRVGIVDECVQNLKRYAVKRCRDYRGPLRLAAVDRADVFAVDLFLDELFEAHHLVPPGPAERFRQSSSSRRHAVGVEVSNLLW